MIVSERPQSRSVEWSRVSPRGRAVIAQIGLRLTAGWSFEEIADAIQDARPKMADIELPEKVTKAWVMARWRELRREVKELG